MAKETLNREAVELARHMAAVRDARGLDLKDLVQRTGMKELSVRRLFTGEVHANFLKLIKIARAMGVTPNELLGFPEPAHEEQAALMDRVRGAIEALLAAMGYQEESLQTITEAVLKALKSQPLPAHSERASAVARVATVIDNAGPPPKHPR